MRRCISFWRGVSEGSVACWTIGEGPRWGGASEDQLLGMRVTDNEGIIMATV